MSLAIQPLPAFTDNYIWTLTDTAHRQVCVVDPGDAAPVSRFLEDKGLQLSHILITHHHPDHIGGVGELVAAWSPVVFGPQNPGIHGITDHLQEGDEIKVWDSSFRILEVPGHTLDHIAYYCEDGPSPILFCGDTLFAAGCGRLFEGTAKQMQQSLAKLTDLPSDTLVYCTHEYTLANLKFALAAEPGNEELVARIGRETQKRENDEVTLPSTIALELATNPFLRCQSKEIRQVLENKNLQTDSDAAVFAALRQWKDNF